MASDDAPRWLDREAAATLASSFPGRPCCYCGRRMMLTAGRPRHPTRDHILPRARGRPHIEVRNLRMACRGCNSMRGALGHCPAVLLIVLAVAEERRVHPWSAARFLGWPWREAAAHG